MTAHTRTGQFIYYTGDAFDADAPVSTGLTHAKLNNLVHLHDMSSQHRINWFQAGDLDPLTINASDATDWYFLGRWTFPWSFAIDGWLRQPVLAVYGYGNGGTLTVRAVISPFGEATVLRGGVQVMGANHDAFLTVEDSTTATSSTLLIYYPVVETGTWQTDKADMLRRMRQSGMRNFSTPNNPTDDEPVGVVVPTLALELWAQYDADSETNDANVTRVSLREFVGP